MAQWIEKLASIYRMEYIAQLHLKLDIFTQRWYEGCPNTFVNIVNIKTG